MKSLNKMLVSGLTLMMILGSSVSIAFAASNTTNVTFTEVGLPSGTNWTVTFNGSPQSSTTNQIVFAGQTQLNCLGWSTASTISTGLGAQSVTAQTGGCMNTSGTVPVQNTQAIVYTSQVQVTFAVSPSGTGTVSLGTGFYNTGTPIVVSAVPNIGQTFSSWKSSTPSITFGSTSAASTTFTATAPGTITANFKAAKFSVIFTEFGLPASTSWQVTFNGNTLISSSTTLAFTGTLAGCYSWSAVPVPAGAGVQYAPTPSSSSFCVPGQTAQELVYVKQDQVTFAVNPSGAGSTSPSGASFFNDASQTVVTAFGNVNTVFASWSATGSITFASSTSASTVATISGTGTITANFNPATPCTTCTVTFTEVGLPSGTAWGVNFNGQAYTGTTATITISNVPAGGYSYGPTASIAGGTGTIYTASSGSFISVGASQTTQAILYTKQFLVKFSISPSGSGSTNPSSPIYVNAGSTFTLLASPSAGFAFSAWKGVKNAIVMQNSKSPSAGATVTGPGTITATFKPLTSTLTFTEQGLPSGTIWSVTLGGVSYFSTTGNPSTVTVTGQSQGFQCWSLTAGTQNPIFGGAGIQYAAVNTSGCMNVPQQTTQTVLFAKQFAVSFVVSPSGSGTISPTGTVFITSGSVVALQAFATAGFAFVSWGSTGSITIANTASAATAATVNSAGTITGTF